jgi:hypothetical protein
MTFPIDPKTGKEHREFFAITEEGWEEVSPGIHFKILAGVMDEKAGRGHQNRVARWAPNARLDSVNVHPYYEEVFVASGSFLVVSQEDPSRTDVFPAFSFACRPPGAKHGPFQAGPEGCVLFETIYFA